MGEGEPDRMTDARRRVLERWSDYGGLAFTLKELAMQAGVTSSVVKGLVKQGAVREEDTSARSAVPASRTPICRAKT